MSAFLIFIRERLRDPDLFNAYAAEARTTVPGHDVKLLAMNGDHLTLEGAEVEGVLILQFDNIAAARAWYESPAYSAVREKRHLSADYRVIVTAGV